MRETVSLLYKIVKNAIVLHLEKGKKNAEQGNTVSILVDFSFCFYLIKTKLLRMRSAFMNKAFVKIWRENCLRYLVAYTGDDKCNNSVLIPGKKHSLEI